MLATHREELEEWILENLPLLILVSDHWNIHFAEILREQEDQTDRAVGKQKTGQNMSLSWCPKAWPSLTAISVIVLKHGMLPYIPVRGRSEQVNTCHFTQQATINDTCCRGLWMSNSSSKNVAIVAI